MEMELIRQYGFKMASLYADKVVYAQPRGYSSEYLQLLQSRQEFWRNIAQLPSDSPHWQVVKKYFQLISDPKASQVEIRTLYKFLEETIKLHANVS
ncbi:MAG TPA: hypothetical protein V6D11_22330 [Waterburya sp.]|jgi:hypothetical protein